MKIIEDCNKIKELEVGDLLILSNSGTVSYLGKRRLICHGDRPNTYKLVALDRNDIIPYEYSSLKEVYTDYKDNITRIVPKDRMELILG